MKKLFVAIVFLIITAMAANSQEYTTGIGLRGGIASGITAKHFISDNTAIEGLLSLQWRGVGITGLYEIHNLAFDVPGLYWFYGAGAHLSFYEGHPNHPWFDEDRDDYTVIGLDGILGLEYNFAEIPFNVSIDWKPEVNIIGHTGVWFGGGGISVRYIF